MGARCAWSNPNPTPYPNPNPNPDPNPNPNQERNLDILISEQLGLTSHRGPPPSEADEVVLGGAESALATARLAAGATSGAPLRLRRDLTPTPTPTLTLVRVT